MSSPALTSPASRPSSARPARRRRRRHDGEESTGALQLAEEAFHLLRTTPASGLWLYYAGTVPFVLAVFYFWADMSRSSHAETDAPLGALALAVAYFWMKACQGLFCRGLWERLHPSGRPLRLSRGRFARHLAAQMFIHAFALPVRVLSLPFFGWTSAFFQNASVLAFTRDFGRQPLRGTISLAARFAHWNWGQTHAVLLLMAVISLFVWINVVGTVALVPMALKTFFGVESVFTMNPGSTLMNTTFLFGSLLLTFLVIDPMMKAIHTLRCFRALSRTTGTDLLSRLARVRALAALVAGLLLLSGTAHGQETSGPPPAESTGPATTEALQTSIEQTLRGKEYQWRYPRREGGATDDAEKSWLARQLTALADSIERSAKSAGKALDEMMRKLFESDRSRARREPSMGAGAGESIGLMARLMLVAVVIGLLVWVAVLLLRRAVRDQPVAPDDGGPHGPIDLENEAIVATQLPEDEWMRLAREQIAKGEHRLAVRALFLASLAHLGDRGLLSIARFKSNRDYSRELLLKARSLPELRSAFGENIGLFERVWYGLHEIGRESIDRFTANYERITLQSDSATVPADRPLPPAR
jgi:hypothetical protein